MWFFASVSCAARMLHSRLWSRYRLAVEMDSSLFAKTSQEKRPMTKRVLPKIAAAIIVVSGAAAMAVLIAPALAQDLPSGNGPDMGAMVRTGCHDLEPIARAVGF